MNFKTKLTSAVSSLIVGGMLVTASTGAFAAVDNKSIDNSGSPVFVKADKFEKGHKFKAFRCEKGFEEMISELVKDGTITQSEGDRISSFLKTRDEQRRSEMEKIKAMTEEQRKKYFADRKPSGKDIFSELVGSKIITQQKADAIRVKMREKAEVKGAERLKEISSGLEGLINKGTITKEQANRIIDSMKSKDQERKALYEKTRNMTPEEKKAYFEKLRGEKRGFLSDMVNKGELTEEQADAVRQIIKGTRK